MIRRRRGQSVCRNYICRFPRRKIIGRLVIDKRTISFGFLPVNCRPLYWKRDSMMLFMAGDARTWIIDIRRFAPLPRASALCNAVLGKACAKTFERLPLHNGVAVIVRRVCPNLMIKRLNRGFYSVKKYFFLAFIYISYLIIAPGRETIHGVCGLWPLNLKIEKKAAGKLLKIE